MTDLSEQHIAALQQLSAGLHDIDWILIGAAALRLQLGARTRATEDLDVTLAIEADELVSIFAKFPDWTTDSRIEHQLHTPTGVRVDCLPAGPKVLEAGALIWPKSGKAMNMIGFRLAFEQYNLIDIASHLKAKVAAVSVLALLKMISFMDRPFERERDLEDLTFILDHYLGPVDERRWDDDTFAHSPDYDTAPAFCLGRDLGKIVDRREESEFRTFVSLFNDDTNRPELLASAVRQAGKKWHGDPEAELRRRLQAMLLGLDISRRE